MSTLTHNALQSALYGTLSGDATLSGMATGIFDRPAQNTDFPYITIGESVCSDWSTKTSTGTKHELEIHIWSREGGRKQTASIMERIYSLLHNQNISIIGQSLVFMRFIASSITLENDGWTYHGMLKLHAMMHDSE
jgi:hypothetical protein